MAESQQSAVDDPLPSVAHLAGKYMAFQLAHEAYALEILNVRELIGLIDIARMPIVISA